MKYFSHGNQYVNAECQNCGKVLKIPKEKCITVKGGLSVAPAVICQCGMTSNFIDDETSEYQKNANWTPKKYDHRMPELINLIKRFLPLNKWGFKMSAQYICHNNKWNSIESSQNYSGIADPVIIYDSEKCRFRATYSYDSPDNYHMEYHVIFEYGRLGVRDNAHWLLTNTNHENYHLHWHHIDNPLYYFLEGLSPQEAKNATAPRLIMEIGQLDLAKQMSDPEKDLLLHATIWETYGQRLFDIFDARNPDLWERYCAFVKEYWDTYRLEYKKL